MKAIGMREDKTTRNSIICIIFSAAIVFALILFPAFSSVTTNVVIRSTGEVTYSRVTATSGSPADIQNAINTISSAGGGTVYIPAGNWTFNPPVNKVGVTILYTTPINIFGAGASETFLIETQNTGNSTMFQRKWTGQNANGSALRISGICFVGWVNMTDESDTSNVGVDIRQTPDFRVDHCRFINFAGQGIYTDYGSGGTYHLVGRGLIDHCSFDNPYKIAEQPHNATGAYFSQWGYGIIVCGDALTWDVNMGDLLGHYYPVTLSSSSNQPSGFTYFGEIIPQPVYIEHCNFTRCRHAISANEGGFYVARYDYFCDPAPYGQCDMHGDDGASAPYNFGTRASEVYSCIFNLTDNSYSGGQEEAWEVRGGGGVFWNNTVYLPSNYPYAIEDMVLFSNDGEPAPYSLNQVYIWNNTCVYANGTTTNGDQNIYFYAGNPVLNVNYFFRAPSQAQDGFTYTPYPYPFPFNSLGLP